MTPFVWLLMGHLVGDYLFQTRWMAEEKINSFYPLLIHCLIYTVMVYLFSLPFGGISIFAVLILFVSHFLLDTRLIVKWWMNNITGGNQTWLYIIKDQIFHLLILVFILHT